MTKAKLKLARRAALRKVIRTFTNGPRSMHPNQQVCVYSGTYKEEGKPAVHTGCAIGILIPRKLAAHLDSFLNSAVCYDEVFALLPPHTRALGQEFLSELQALHDCARNWKHPHSNPAGPLTKDGERDVAYIEERYKL